MAGSMSELSNKAQEKVAVLAADAFIAELEGRKTDADALYARARIVAATGKRR